MSTDLAPTRRLARFAAELTYEQIPADVVQKEKWHLLDGLGNGLYGSTTAFGQAVVAHVRDFPSLEEAVVWGAGLRATCLQAALANGSFANVGELEDAHHRTKFKPNTLIVPAGLALAERLGASGRALLAALIAGNEVGIRVAEGLHSGKEAYARGWLGTGVVGALASAASAGRLLDLDEEQMAQALSIGGAQPMGLWAGGLSMSKRLLIGRAAESGIFSAFIAQKGITGGDDVLEAPWGSLPDIASGIRELDKMTFELGSYWKTREIGLEYYPTKGALHSALDAVIAIVTREDLSGEEIERIVVRTTSGIVNNKALYVFPPQDFWEAQHSFPYCLAVAAYDRECHLEQLRPERLGDPKVLDLGRRISMQVEAEADRLYPKTKTAFVDVTTKRGQTYTHRVDYCTGEPENFLSREQIHEKFRKVARYALDETAMARVVDLVERLDELSDVRELTAPLLGAPVGVAAR